MKAGLWQGGNWLRKASWPSQKNWQGADWAKAFQEAGLVVKSPLNCLGVSVVRGVQVPLSKGVERFYGMAPTWVDETDLTALGLVVEAEQVGGDRLVTAFGCWLREKADWVLLDFGTATTYEVITLKGHFLGGLILPGLKLAMESLEQATEGLRQVPLEVPSQWIGKNTEQAIQSGIILGNAMMADRFAEKIAQQMGRPFRLIATGGLGRLVAPQSPAIERWEEDLTLKALVEIWLAQQAR